MKDKKSISLNELAQMIKRGGRHANYWCRDCGFAYRLKGDYLTVHHFNEDKADCRWGNLIVFCWSCHIPDHTCHHGLKHYYCRRCKQGGFLGWEHYGRHLRGIHGVLFDGSKIKKAA